MPSMCNEESLVKRKLFHDLLLLEELNDQHANREVNSLKSLWAFFPTLDEMGPTMKTKHLSIQCSAERTTDAKEEVFLHQSRAEFGIYLLHTVCEETQATQSMLIYMLGALQFGMLLYNLGCWCAIAAAFCAHVLCLQKPRGAKSQLRRFLEQGAFTPCVPGCADRGGIGRKMTSLGSATLKLNNSRWNQSLLQESWLPVAVPFRQPRSEKSCAIKFPRYFSWEKTEHWM